MEKSSKKRSFLMVNPLILVRVTNLYQSRLIGVVFFMKAEERLINSFYSCFRSRDWRGMVEVYHPEVFFYDPVFGNLEGPEVGAMWAMLLEGGKARSTELDLQFGGIKGE